MKLNCQGMPFFKKKKCPSVSEPPEEGRQSFVIFGSEMFVCNDESPTEELMAWEEQQIQIPPGRQQF